MATIGTAYVQIAPTTKGLGAAISKAFSGQGSSAGNSLGKTAGMGFAKSSFAVAVGGVFASAISKGVNTISQSLGAAANRYDTMTNFPKVMQNFGISSDKADAAIQKLDKGIAGLPTSMDAAASGVQNITASTGDVDKATDIFLSLNNAILAGGKPMEVQSSAMEQFTQAFSKGKPDMMEWRSLQNAMPAQLKQIATAMGYVGETGVSQLGEDLRTGKISMTEFTDTLVKMNDTGIKGFPSLAEQAKNATGGINVGMANMKTAITRGLANIMGTFDTTLKNAGFAGGIFGILDNARKGIDTAMESIRNSITKVMDGVSADKSMGENVSTIFQNLFTLIIDFVTNNLPTIMTNGVKILTAIIQGIAQSAPQIVPAIVNALLLLVNAIIQNLSILVNAGLKLVIALIQGLVRSLPQLTAQLPKIINTISMFLIENIPVLILAAVQLFLAIIMAIPKIIKALVPQIPKIIGAIVIGIIAGGVRLIAAGVKLFLKFWQGIKDTAKELPGKIKNLLSGIGQWFKDAFDKGGIGGVGKALLEGIWKGVSNLGKWLWEKLEGLGGTVLKILKKALGINSPSKYTTYFGEMLGGGLGLGFDKSVSAFKKEIRPQMKSVLSEFSMPKSISAPTISEPARESQGMVSDILTGMGALFAANKNQKIEIVTNLDGKEVARNSFDWFPDIMKQKGVTAIG